MTLVPYPTETVLIKVLPLSKVIRTRIRDAAHRRIISKIYRTWGFYVSLIKCASNPYVHFPIVPNTVFQSI